MAANTADIDVILDTKDLEVPSCAHGPALLFVRYVGKERRRFFACSAFRDRKDCSFYQSAEEHISAEKREQRIQLNKHLQPKYSHSQYYERSSTFKKLKEKNRFLCQTCGLLLLPKEKTDHNGHTIKWPISKDMILRPTYLFSPLDDNKTYAQYLFSNTTVDFVISALQKLHFTHVLCLGAPRIFEAIEHMPEQKSLRGLLLDLDYRYEQIYPCDKFCRYNMFNHHFFDEETSGNIFKDFIEENEAKHVVMVMDPPFGGMVEALSATYRKISKSWKALLQGTSNTDKDIAVFWFFPYFMEKRIRECLPHIHMLDYKVDYDNHSLYKSSKKKKGSPVRIFTNLPSASVELPQPQYWYCKACEKYSAKENLHCDVCHACTSKDGNTYQHCFKCERCVKPSKTHCDTCKSCQPAGHVCGSVNTGCHICGEQDHKRRNCPQNSLPKTHSTVKRKSSGRCSGKHRKRRK